MTDTKDYTKMNADELLHELVNMICEMDGEQRSKLLREARDIVNTRQ